jgi:hypothetical protein
VQQLGDDPNHEKIAEEPNPGGNGHANYVVVEDRFLNLVVHLLWPHISYHIETEKVEASRHEVNHGPQVNYQLLVCETVKDHLFDQVKDQRGGEDAAQEVYLVVLLDAVLNIGNLSELSEAIEAFLLEKVQVGEIDQLEDDDHRQGTHQVLLVDVVDRGCSELVLEPVFLLLEGLIRETVEYQAGKVNSLVFNPFDGRISQVCQQGYVLDLTVALERVLPLPHLLNNDADLVVLKELVELIHRDYLQQGAVLEVRVQEDAGELLIVEVVQNLISQEEHAGAHNLALVLK